MDFFRDGRDSSNLFMAEVHELDVLTVLSDTRSF